MGLRDQEVMKDIAREVPEPRQVAETDMKTPRETELERKT
jgi:hypothetical protein